MANIFATKRFNILSKYDSVFLGIFIMVASPTAGFLLSDDPCVVPAPCTCSLYGISCINASLTSIPTFEILKSNQGYFSIAVMNNNITSVPENAFGNVSLIHPSTLDILLRNNEIVSIHPEAFVGVENITSLDLDDNKLTSLPSALVKLDKLQSLSLRQNPISFLDPTIMSKLGRSLIQFHVDMHDVATWPKGLNSLVHLDELVLMNFQLRYLPLDAFDGQTVSLTHLVMSGILARLPNAICHLRSLNTLQILFMSSLDSDSFGVHCSQPLLNLTSLTIQYGSLRTFPAVLLEFPSLISLSLEKHGIRFIHTNVIPQFSSLHSIHLSNNSFSQIPFALNKLTNLTHLDLSRNNIMTVEDNDLIGLSKLTNLALSFNPIEYIAPNAFKNNQVIVSLFLDHTKLHLVPEAVALLPELRRLDFRNNNAECSCKLSYLKGWNATRIYRFEGDCDCHKSIKSYLLSELTSCP